MFTQTDELLNDSRDNNNQGINSNNQPSTEKEGDKLGLEPEKVNEGQKSDDEGSVELFIPEQVDYSTDEEWQDIQRQRASRSDDERQEQLDYSDNEGDEDVRNEDLNNEDLSDEDLTDEDLRNEDTHSSPFSHIQKGIEELIDLPAEDNGFATEQPNSDVTSRIKQGDEAISIDMTGTVGSLSDAKGKGNALNNNKYQNLSVDDLIENVMRDAKQLLASLQSCESLDSLKEIDEEYSLISVSETRASSKLGERDPRQEAVSEFLEKVSRAIAQKKRELNSAVRVNPQGGSSDRDNFNGSSSVNNAEVLGLQTAQVHEPLEELQSDFFNTTSGNDERFKTMQSERQVILRALNAGSVKMEAWDQYTFDINLVLEEEASRYFQKLSPPQQAEILDLEEKIKAYIALNYQAYSELSRANALVLNEGQVPEQVEEEQPVSRVKNPGNDKLFQSMKENREGILQQLREKSFTVEQWNSCKFKINKFLKAEPNSLEKLSTDQRLVISELVKQIKELIALKDQLYLFQEMKSDRERLHEKILNNNFSVESWNKLKTDIPAKFISHKDKYLVKLTPSQQLEIQALETKINCLITRIDLWKVVKEQQYQAFIDKINEFASEPDLQAAADRIADKIEELAKKYIGDELNLDAFKKQAKDCLADTNEDVKKLSEYRGWMQVIVDLLTAITVIGLIAQACYGTFTLFRVEKEFGNKLKDDLGRAIADITTPQI